MKIRIDFVTNSSSSGFVVINVKSKTLSKIFNEFGLSLDIFNEIEDIYGAENGNPNLITDSVANTICSLLEDAKESDICEEVDEDTLDQVIEEIEVNRETIDADAEVCIESGVTYSDDGGPSIEYAKLMVNKGKGTFVEYSISDGFYGDDDDPSPFYKWAKEHGYYDPANEEPGVFEGGYDHDLYFSPPYDEIAGSYEEVRRVRIGDYEEDSTNNPSKIDFDGKYFVLTGFSVDEEKKVSNIITERGGIIKSSTVLYTDYLIRKGNESTNKYKRALELNQRPGRTNKIVIMSAAEFYRLIK